MKHCGLFPHRMDARDRHNGQREKRTNGRTDEQSVRPSVRLLDRVWHFMIVTNLWRYFDDLTTMPIYERSVYDLEFVTTELWSRIITITAERRHNVFLPFEQVLRMKRWSISVNVCIDSCLRTELDEKDAVENSRGCCRDLHCRWSIVAQRPPSSSSVTGWARALTMPASARTTRVAVITAGRRKPSVSIGQERMGRPGASRRYPSRFARRRRRSLRSGWGGALERAPPTTTVVPPTRNATLMASIRSSNYLATPGNGLSRRTRSPVGGDHVT